MSTITKLQWVIWIAVFLIIFFSLLPEDGLPHAAIFTSISVSFYLLVIYGNIKFLFPQYYEKGQKVKYIMFSIILLVGGGLARGFLAMWVWNNVFRPQNPNQ